MWRGISLANKCLLLFGGAIVLIVLAALSVPWLRMNSLVGEGQVELSRRLLDSWVMLDEAAPPGSASAGDEVEHGGIRAARLSLAQAEKEAASDPFLAMALRKFRADADRTEVQDSSWRGFSREYRYARAV